MHTLFSEVSVKGSQREGKKKPGKEWRWEQVVKQCEKHEGEKQQTPARETQPGSSITFQQSSADGAAQTAAGEDTLNLLH